MERLLPFSLLVSVFAGTGLNKRNLLQHSSQDRCVFQRPACPAPTECRASCKDARSSSSGEIPEQTGSLSVVSSALLGVWCFLTFYRKLPHCCQFSRIHLWATLCTAPKDSYWGTWLWSLWQTLNYV